MAQKATQGSPALVWMVGSPWKCCLLEIRCLSDWVTWAHVLLPKSFLLELLCLAILSPKGRLFPGARSLLFCQTWQETSVVVSLRWSWKTSTRSFEQFSHSWKHLSGFWFLLLPFFPFCFYCRQFYLCSFFPTQVEIQAIIIIIIILDVLHSSILKIFSEVGLLKSLCAL